MRFFVAALVALIMFAPTGAHCAEYISAPAEATVVIENDDHAVARREAISAAFVASSRLVAAGLVSADRREEVYAIIEKSLQDDPARFVASYKFLGESVDPEGEKLTVRLQTTLFLDSLRAALAEGGAPVRRRLLPALLIIVDERSMDFFTSPNFLLLNSLSEEILTRNYRDRGYRVVNRMQVREAALDKAVMAAMKGDNDTLEGLAGRLKVEMILFGRTEVTVASSAVAGDEVTTSVTLRLLAPDGSQLAEQKETYGAVYDDPLKGSVETITTAAEKVAREIAVTTPRVWKELNRRRGGAR